MKKFFERLRIKIRTWNPSWFVNPFYSPSIDAWQAGDLAMAGFPKAYINAIEKYEKLIAISGGMPPELFDETPQTLTRLNTEKEERYE